MSPIRFEQPHDAGRALAGSSFFTSPLGRELEAAEMRVLRQILADCFGARALLLGAGMDERLLDALHVQRRVVARLAEVETDARRSPVSTTHATIVDPGNLPFANASFDVVVLFHGLDLAARPPQALREAARVLADGGRLVVTGFNPWSLWGLRRLVSSRRTAPWNANFIAPGRMVDWLSLLEFGTIETRFTRFRPPMLGGGRLFDGRTAQRAKSLLRTPFGGVWIIKARRQPPRPVLDLAPQRRGALPPRVAAAGPAARDRGHVLRFPGIHDRDR
jgi:SAM-dependent methyltransferase